MSRRGWWSGPATIDGLAGSGKSTVARVLAGDILPVLEVGQLYRRLATETSGTHTGPRSVDQSGDWVARRLQASPLSPIDADVNLDRLLAVSQDPRIRQEVSKYQRFWAAHQQQSIIVGRIGGHIFPEAEVKLFLSVNAQEQARRFGESRAGPARLRDSADRTRAHDPVRPAEGALCLDTSDLTIDEVVAIIDELVRRSGR